ncbi:hypothetical protein LR48_Vigan05g133500 [Vigna angularis]|uniref:Ubiquitin-like protease family profile domain-containing protein n=1 Tax=Phaseolus angularis TaxID=3914 RepID=A0A0L9ULE9_PHAAN|nr:hypothetical protein LR48_Vigan05g133500 [Vigna angularis]
MDIVIWTEKLMKLNSNVINSVPFSKLDNIDELNIYNWGDAVYSLIKSSLNRAADKYNRKTYHDAIHIAGCAAVLQLWVLEHISLYDIGGRSIYPRILHWIVIKDKRRKIISTFERTEILWDFHLSEEQFQNEEIKESLGSIGETNSKSYNDNFDFARVVEEQRLLRTRVDNHAERLLELQRRIRRLEEEVLNEMPSFNDGMEGPSTDDKARDLAIVNFLDGGVEGPSTNENIVFSNVYRTCTSGLCNDGAEVLLEVSNNMLTIADFKCLRPRGKIDNMTMVMERMKIPKKKREALPTTDYHHFFQPQSFPLNVLLTSEFLFVPTVGDDHWWCYAVNCQSREMFILDSLGHKRRRRKSIDKAMVATLQQLFNMIDIDSNCKEQELKVIEEDLPVQPNTLVNLLVLTIY